jgi:hypothetical protein
MAFVLPWNDFLIRTIILKTNIMREGILAKVDEQISQYKANHKGEDPLYILVSSHEEEALLEAVKKQAGAKSDHVVTSYKESKILRYEALQKGQLLVTNELPGD